MQLRLKHMCGSLNCVFLAAQAAFICGSRSAVRSSLVPPAAPRWVAKTSLAPSSSSSHSFPKALCHYDIIMYRRQQMFQWILPNTYPFNHHLDQENRTFPSPQKGPSCPSLVIPVPRTPQTHGLAVLLCGLTPGGSYNAHCSCPLRGHASVSARAMGRTLVCFQLTAFRSKALNIFFLHFYRGIKHLPGHLRS